MVCCDKLALFKNAIFEHSQLKELITTKYLQQIFPYATAISSFLVYLIQFPVMFINTTREVSKCDAVIRYSKDLKA